MPLIELADKMLDNLVDKLVRKCDDGWVIYRERDVVGSMLLTWVAHLWRS